MEQKIVNIYCLYDPQKLKIRYIGRTTSSLKKRLRGHISKAKHFKSYFPDKNGSYVVNWINSLLKDGIRPGIRLLTTVYGWGNSHQVEKNIIQKHLVKHNLVNGDDRGPGGLAKNVNPITEKQRVNKIKTHFNKEENKINFYNTVYTYDLQGKFVKEYASLKFVSEELHIDRNKIVNYMNSLNHNKQRKPVGDLYFSHTKYDIYPFVRSKESLNRIVLIVDAKKYETLSSFCEENNLSDWDKSQLSKMVLTKKVKEYFVGKFVKVIKNGTAVLERNF